MMQMKSDDFNFWHLSTFTYLFVLFIYLFILHLKFTIIKTDTIVCTIKNSYAVKDMLIYVNCLTINFY